jgi:hypothetical protein
MARKLKGVEALPEVEAQALLGAAATPDQDELDL